MSAPAGMSWRPYDPCPCGCGVVGWKTVKALPGDDVAHVVGCMCRRHLGKRNRDKGRRSQTRGARKLGHTGKTAADEEATRALPIMVQVEFKSGYARQIVRFRQFIETKFFQRALSQAERARRVGEGSLPGVMLDDDWLIVDCRKGVEGDV
jgi:hypothetical protein